MQQARFYKRCIEKLTVWPAPVKPEAWYAYISAKLRDAETIEAPDEASPEGRFLWHLEQFCVVTAPARNREEILLGKPWTDGGYHYFRSEDLMRYLNQHHFRDLSARQAWALLREQAKAATHQFSIKGRCVQCWKVPEFPKQTDNFSRVAPAEEF